MEMIENCPICGEMYTDRARCMYSESYCDNGHTWFYCPEDNKRIIGKAPEEYEHKCLCKIIAPTIVSIYESASTDGYRSTGDKKYYLDYNVSKTAGRQKHGSYAVNPIEHFAIQINEDEFLILESTIPVALTNSKTEIENIKKEALAKLTPEEQKVLGF